MAANFFVTIKGKDKHDRNREKSYSVSVKDEAQAKEWGERCCSVQGKSLEDYKIQVTPILSAPAAITPEAKTEPAVEEPKKQAKAKRTPKTKAKTETKE